MDTRFWGPSGWKLLHSITFAYELSDKAAVGQMFKMLPFVLPCKFCRASLTEYMETDPVEPALESRAKLTRWLWRIHNEVNKKLRDQKLNVAPDPPFEKVEKLYTELLATGCAKTEFPGWDFLFSIAELHPLSKTAKASVPIPGQDCSLLKTKELKNRWNCLEPDERMPLYKKFWDSIGKSLPFSEWSKSWKENSSNSDFSTRSSTIRWLWKLRCGMEHDLDLLNNCKFSHLCTTLKKHRSGCTKSLRAKTCRKTRR